MAHYWGRRCQAHGHDVQLLPVQYVKPYVRRNKTDRMDTEALLEAARCAGIHPVPVKTAEQQALQALQLHQTAASSELRPSGRWRAQALTHEQRPGDFFVMHSGCQSRFALPARNRSSLAVEVLIQALSSTLSDP